MDSPVKVRTMLVSLTFPPKVIMRLTLVNVRSFAWPSEDSAMAGIKAREIRLRGVDISFSLGPWDYPCRRD